MTATTITRPTSICAYQNEEAIRHAKAALEINPDSAKVYKTHGMPNAMLGKWEEAACDLHSASNINYDDVINACLRRSNFLIQVGKAAGKRWKSESEKGALCATFSSSIHPSVLPSFPWFGSILGLQNI
ncbi:FAM10 family protein At4g22670 isoform X2 [Aegilops tauschii subsp. strangulata]|uniref:FAM10 family protein At4g22670 isoform X2 n=1 Tax=Aegilops tauschii subsp. strangulata TaxID=200361 RepID=UPI001ABD376D|nr:TPR repeat-containing thioredoxin TDX [Aegilops tauschii subsp. strangulata]